ncbi:sigma-E processing peptidase SpoIIGA [Bacillus mesophilum]|uniref:Sigma-E processing peptidase SpoIIGA n=1 Tax=Bacillus mesophilum TaxID=1071718 RepID=A0A7V7RQQ4_9BACI|nr:sigma-E processing peptidase SpoIIGA [Bacillus mesophilum]KAB2335332.1 sigma-E processing peptidase SpoIIGA [Bacillus mesophilum]
MAIYLDVIWALNFLFDTLLLYLTAIILKRHVKWWRLIAGGLIGSIIILLAITPMHSVAGHPLMKLLFSVLMVYTAFGYKRLKFFFSSLMTFYLTTFLIGGVLIGAHYFVQFDFELSAAVMIGSVKGFGDPISWLFVLIGFPLAWHFSRKNIETFEMVKIQYDSLIDVEIMLNSKMYSFKGLIDSGNQLYDPISKMPVMFISIKGNEGDFPEEIQAMAENPEKVVLGQHTVSAEWEHRMRIIPYKVVGQDHQLIIAVKPESIKFRKTEEVLEVNRGLISFTMQELSSDDVFQCIVHPKMMASAKQVSAEIRAG